MYNVKKFIDISAIAGSLSLVISFLVQLVYNHSDTRALVPFLYVAILFFLFVAYLIFRWSMFKLQNFIQIREVMGYLFIVINLGVILWSMWVMELSFMQQYNNSQFLDFIYVSF